MNIITQNFVEKYDWKETKKKKEKMFWETLTIFPHPQPAGYRELLCRYCKT